MSPEDRQLIEDMAEQFAERLKSNWEPGFGVFPSALPSENFYEQVWTRDFALMGGNYFATQNPQVLIDSLTTILAHQRADGALPLRVERQYMVLKLIPGLRFLAKPLFTLIEHFRGRRERPVFKGQDFSHSEDTVPATLIAVGELFIASPAARPFIAERLESLTKAIAHFRTKIDPADGLVVVQKKNADWVDSINRGGKLGDINVWWARALSLMSTVALQLGKKDEADNYQAEFSRTKQSILTNLYDAKGAYIRAEEKEDRIDAVASIFGSLYLLNPEECARVQETLRERLKRNSGLKNFDPSYPSSQILWPHKLIGHGGYHNHYIWPWITCRNIQVKVKIALEHTDENVRNWYKTQAVEDLLDATHLFADAGGAYEVFFPDNRKPAITTWYKPPQNFMANLVAYEDAYRDLKRLNWI